MAGDWIKMRVSLPDDPAVIRIVDSVGIDTDAVIGKLFRLWAWADTQTTDGAAKVGTAWVDRYTGTPGFAEAMRDAGWLIVTSDGIMFPKFDRHNGKSAKVRADNTERQRVSRDMRDKNVTDARQKRDASSLLSSSLVSSSGGGPGEPDHRIPNDLLFREVLRHYPRQEAIRGAYDAANDAAYRLAHSKHGGNVDAALGFLGQRVREYAKAKTGSEARYIPMARKWFEDGRYNDDPATWAGEAKPKTAAEMIDEAEEKERKRKAAKGLV